jgi:hypothetical protein
MRSAADSTPLSCRPQSAGANRSYSPQVAERHGLRPWTRAYGDGKVPYLCGGSTAVAIISTLMLASHRHCTAG